MVTIDVVENGVRVYDHGILILEAQDSRDGSHRIDTLIDGNEDPNICCIKNNQSI